ncbi:isoprenyl transferase [candidate division SR1 bacterium]|nr:isoprenyl transferase [candidate division SR1 bacterium]
MTVIPYHIGLIIDGNRRWAKNKSLPTFEGHRVGAETLDTIVEYIFNRGVNTITVYGFSTENWKRNQIEVSVLMKIFLQYLMKMNTKLVDKGIKVNILGDKSAFNSDLQQAIQTIEESTRRKTEHTFNLCLNYGGRADLIQAIKHISDDVKQGDLKPEDIDDELVSQYLYTGGQPDPDLIIRTSGENRLSGFLAWQSAYSELLFIKTMRPDFSPEIFEECLAEYEKRQRRFGE